MDATDQGDLPRSSQKKDETFAFLFLAFVLFPVLAIVIVGGYGFIVWMQHLMFGPPGI